MKIVNTIQSWIDRKFYERFGSPGLISLTDNRFSTPCQKFLEKYKEMEKDFTDENELFEAVVKALAEEKSLIASNEQKSSGNSMASMFTSAVNNKASQKSTINVADVLSEK